MGPLAVRLDNWLWQFKKLSALPEPYRTDALRQKARTMSETELQLLAHYLSLKGGVK